MGGREYVRIYIDVKGKPYIGTAEIKFNANPKTPDGMSPFECGETSALGRALGFAGYGVVDSIASADEVVSNEQQEASGKALHDLGKPGSYAQHHEPPITDQQKTSVRKLYEHLGEAVDEGQIAAMTYQQAKEAIIELSAKYRQMREKPAPAPVVEAAQASGHHDLPTLRDLQARCKVLFGAGRWQAVILKASTASRSPIRASFSKCKRPSSRKRILARELASRRI